MEQEDDWDKIRIVKPTDDGPELIAELNPDPDGDTEWFLNHDGTLSIRFKETTDA
jgi:hypothetical protein